MNGIKTNRLSTPKRRILLSGASGGLGSALFAQWKEHHSVMGLCYSNYLPELTPIDLRQKEPIQKLVQEFKPDLIVHTVGMTNVDRCDQDLELALDINTRSTLHMRLAAEAISCKMIHISTNDVFSGFEGMYTETDRQAGVNMYSKTKSMAEQMLYNYDNSLILRFTILSWYAAGKTTFAAWLYKSLKAGQTITLYTDQFNSPLYIDTLAKWIEQLFDAQGVYHLGSGRHSRWETGIEIAKALNLDTSLIQKGSVKKMNLPAPRPLDVSLDCTKVASEYGLHTTLRAEIEQLIADKPDR